MSDLAVPPAPGAPTKIPLVSKKSIRDAFDQRKDELEKAISNTLGEPWTIHVDTTGVYSYINANESINNDSAGTIIYSYFDGALSWLKNFATDRPKDVPALARNAPKRIITLEPTNRDDVPYASTDFKDGRWRLLFRDSNIGVNVDNALADLGHVLNEASKSSGAKLSLAAERSIREEYETDIKEILAQARKLLNEQAIVFEPNFKSNFAALAAYDASPEGSSLKKGWDASIGRATLSYFQGFVDALKYQQFGVDDMMQEAFNETVASHVVAFQVTDETTRTYNDCTISDGKLVIRTKAGEWWTNVNDACEKLVELL